MEELLLVLFAIGAFFGLPVTAIVVAVKARNETRAVRREVAMLRQRLGVSPPTVAPPEAFVPSAPEPEPSVLAPVEAEPVAAPSIASEPEREPVAPPPPPPWEKKRDVEEVLSGRWAVWVGAVALGLGGLFLVKYSIEQGLLGPAARVALGLLLGAGLVGAAEWLRRRPAGRVDPRVAAALVAGGTATLFASIYAAHALYQFLSSASAFPLLGGVAALAVGLSLRHGAPVAALGIIGAYAVPVLVSAEIPRPAPFFGYLLLVLAAAMAVARHTGWRFLPAMALAGGTLLPLLWVATGRGGIGDGAFAAYLALGLGVIIALHREALFVFAGAALFAVLFLVLASATDHGFPALLGAVAFLAIGAVGGWRTPSLDRIPWMGGALLVLLLASWGIDVAPDEPGSPLYGLVPASEARFARTAALYAILAGGIGFIGVWGAARPGRWAALAAAAPLAILALAFARLADLSPSLPWAGLGLLTGLALLAATAAVARHRAAPGMTEALAVLAVGVAGAVALAFAMGLENAWLTVALAAELPAMAWIGERTGVRTLRPAARILTAICLARLVINPYVLDYPIGEGLLFNWLLWGYLLPALSFSIAANIFRRQADDHLVFALEAGAIAFMLLFLTYETRHAFVGELGVPSMGFGEQATHAVVWLLATFALLLASRLRPRPVLGYAWRIVGVIAGVQMLILLLRNPLAEPIDVGALPFFNLVTLAYGIPAIVAALIFAEAGRQRATTEATIAGVASLLLGFVTVSLWVRHAAQGRVLSGGDIGEGESYAYTLVWLLYGAALLAVGFWRQSAALRRAGLLVVALTVAKAFLIDMSELSGLYRAASFLLLGLGLVALGWIYRRFVPAQALRT